VSLTLLRQALRSMGAKGSTLLGKAQPCDATFLGFTTWESSDLDDMRTRHTHDLGGSFALVQRQVSIAYPPTWI
jgi:hypothetical protein